MICISFMIICIETQHPGRRGIRQQAHVEQVRQQPATHTADIKSPDHDVLNSVCNIYTGRITPAGILSLCNAQLRITS